MMRIFPVILSALFLALAVVGILFLVWPKYQGFAEVRKDIAEHGERIQKGEEVSVQLREMKRAIEGKRENFGKIDIAIPSEVAVAGAYHEIQQMAQAAELILTSVGGGDTKVREEGDAVSLRQAALSLTLEGSYGGMKNFLSQLKSSARMLNTQAVSLENQDELAGILSIQIEVEVYGVSY